jgi:hypothetical protein
MYCGGGHLGFLIGMKNRSFVEDLADPMGKICQNASMKPNCPGMIIGRSSTKFLFYAIGNPRWPPPQDID